MQHIKNEKYPWVSKALFELRESINGSLEFEQGADEVLKKLAEYRILPSGKQIDDIVNVSFGETGFIKNARVIKVHFADSKVLYDLEVPIPIPQDAKNKFNASTRIYNIDSAFVTNENIPQ